LIPRYHLYEFRGHASPASTPGECSKNAAFVNLVFPFTADRIGEARKLDGDGIDYIIELQYTQQRAIFIRHCKPAHESGRHLQTVRSLGRNQTSRIDP